MEQVQEFYSSLEESFGKPKSPVDFGVMQYAFVDGGLKGLLSRVNQEMRLSAKLRLAKVRSGGPSAPAWVELPKPMPVWGSSSFQKTTFTVFVRDSFVEQATLRTLVFCLAHELSHILLESVGHKFRNDEKCVDATAMHFGFAEYLYQSRLESTASSLKYTLSGGHVYTLSYLSDEEVLCLRGLIRSGLK